MTSSSSQKWVPALVIASLLVGAQGTGAMSLFKGKEQMSSSEDVANNLLDFSERVFFSEDDSAFAELDLELSDSDFLGVAINLPRKIDITKRDALPLILATQETGLRAWEVIRNDNCALVAVDLNTREVFFGQPFFNPKSQKSPAKKEGPRPAKPEGGNAVALSTGVTRVDARMVLDLPWRTTRYRLGVVLFDWMSNRIDVSLEGGAPASPASPRRPTPAPAARGGSGDLPTYLATPGAPDLSAESPPAATIKIEPHPDQATKLLVSGAFSIVADSMHLPASPYPISEVGGGEENVGAVVPVTLALFSKNSSVPIRLDWALPVYTATPISPGDRIHGHFSLDAMADTNFELVQGDYVAYLFLEGQFFGPTPFAVTKAAQ